MTGVLVLGPAERARIDEAVATARANPTPWEAGEMIADGSDTNSLDLDERKGNVAEIRARYPAQHVMLGTYRIAISFEQQPAGLFRHLSISTEQKGRVPGLEVVIMVVEAFGFSGWPLQRPSRTWMEEYQPGRHAFNVLELEP
jgi:hypothetical protein